MMFVDEPSTAETVSTISSVRTSSDLKSGLRLDLSHRVATPTRTSANAPAGYSSHTLPETTVGPLHRLPYRPAEPRRSTAAQTEYDEVLSRRATLVKKLMMQGELDERESAELSYIRWRLPRLQPLQVDTTLAPLKRMVEARESIARDIQEFVRVTGVAITSRNRRKKSW